MIKNQKRYKIKILQFNKKSSKQIQPLTPMNHKVNNKTELNHIFFENKSKNEPVDFFFPLSVVSSFFKDAANMAFPFHQATRLKIRSAFSMLPLTTHNRGDSGRNGTARSMMKLGILLTP